MSSPNIEALNDIYTLRDMIALKRVKISKLNKEINGLRNTIEFQNLELDESICAYKLKTKDGNINPCYTIECRSLELDKNINPCCTIENRSLELDEIINP